MYIADYLAAFMGGILSVASACVLPMLPSILAIIGSGADEAFKKRMRSALLFVGGFSLAFIAIGAGVGFLAGQLIPILGAIGTIFGWVLIFAGLLMIVSVERIASIKAFAFLSRTVRVSDHLIKMKSSERFESVRSFLIGLGFGFAWTPCIGPILTGVVIIAANSGSVFISTTLLATFSLGMAIPFLAAAAISATLFRRFVKHGRKIEIISGIVFLVYGILLLTGMLTELTRYLS